MCLQEAVGLASTVPRSRRLIGLMLLGLVLVLAALTYVHFWHRWPIGVGPAGPRVSRETFGKSWLDRQVLLVGIGDSITAGFGATPGHSYFSRLVANPGDEFEDMKGLCLSAVLPRLKATNVAVSGSISLEHLERQIARLGRADSNTLGLIVITTGGNDIIHSYGRMPPQEGAMFGATMEQARPWIDNFEKRLETMIQQISDRFPGGCHIFLANIYDPTDGVGDPEHAGMPPWKDCLRVLRAYNQIITRCVQKHKNVQLVNIHDAFLGHGIHTTQFWREHYQVRDPHWWYYGNVEDPNDRGYDAIRRLFLIEMARVLGERN